MRFVPGPLGYLLTWVVLGAADAFMQRKVLRTIRRLVELAVPTQGSH
jgi:hypothetical protein